MNLIWKAGRKQVLYVHEMYLLFCLIAHRFKETNVLILIFIWNQCPLPYVSMKPMFIPLGLYETNVHSPRFIWNKCSLYYIYMKPMFSYLRLYETNVLLTTFIWNQCSLTYSYMKPMFSYLHLMKPMFS